MTMDGAVDYRQIVKWGAFGLYDENKVRAWWGERNELTASELLGKDIPLSRILWVILRDEVVSPAVVHRAALDSAESLLERELADGTYVDLRSSYALRIKRRWLEGQASLGELRHAQRRAAAAAADVAELGDDRARHIATLVSQASSEDSATAFRKQFYTATQRLGQDDHGQLMRRNLIEALAGS